MQPLTVGIGFFWFMVFVAFVVGSAVGLAVTRSRRREADKAIGDASKLVSDLQIAAKAMSGRHLPPSLHRRVCDFRARFGA